VRSVVCTLKDLQHGQPECLIGKKRRLVNPGKLAFCVLYELLPTIIGISPRSITESSQ